MSALIEQLIRDLHALPCMSHDPIQMMAVMLQGDANGKHPLAVCAGDVRTQALLSNGLLTADIAFDIRNLDGSRPDTICIRGGTIPNPALLLLSTNTEWGHLPIQDYVMNVAFLREDIREAIHKANPNYLTKM